MLSSSNRLPLKTEFRRIKSKGKLFPGRFFGLLLVSTGSQSVPRFTSIISKKVDNKAVKRNQLRRVLVESLRPLLVQIKPGTEGVFLVKKSLANQDQETVRTEISRVLKLAGYLKNEENCS